jgi:GT2 family glycosyltransferase
MSIDLSVIVVAHNHVTDLPACLRSVSTACGRVSSELIAVDNRSSDGSAALIRSTFPTAQVVENRTRQGFSANANRAIGISQGQQLLLLNPDTVLEPDAVELMLSQMDAHPRAGIIAPRLYFPDGTVQPSCRRFPTWRTAVVRRSPLRRWLRNTTTNAYHLMLDVSTDRVQEVDWCLGACVLIRRAAMEDVGMFDEGYRLYVEDIDLCYRMKQRSWLVLQEPRARAVHRHLAVTDRRWLTWRTIAHGRGMLRFMWKHRWKPLIDTRARRSRISTDS